MGATLSIIEERQKRRRTLTANFIRLGSQDNCWSERRLKIKIVKRHLEIIKAVGEGDS